MASKWFLAPALVQLRNDINALYPLRDKTTDGSIGDAAHNARKSDHNADWSANGIVRAIDVDEDLYGPNTTDKGAISQDVVDALTRDSRIAYVIYEARIWTPGAGWKPYTAAGKVGWFNPHKMHFHVSLKHGSKYENDTRPFDLGGSKAKDNDMTPQESAKLEWLFQALLHRDKNGNPQFSYSAANTNRLDALEAKVDKMAAQVDKIQKGFINYPGAEYAAFPAVVNTIREDK